jgi:hypothetical protein
MMEAKDSNNMREGGKRESEGTDGKRVHRWKQTTEVNMVKYLHNNMQEIGRREDQRTRGGRRSASELGPARARERGDRQEEERLRGGSASLPGTGF